MGKRGVAWKPLATIQPTPDERRIADEYDTAMDNPYPWSKNTTLHIVRYVRELNPKITTGLAVMEEIRAMNEQNTLAPSQAKANIHHVPRTHCR